MKESVVVLSNLLNKVPPMHSGEHVEVMMVTFEIDPDTENDIESSTEVCYVTRDIDILIVGQLKNNIKTRMLEKLLNLQKNINPMLKLLKGLLNCNKLSGFFLID